MVQNLDKTDESSIDMQAQPNCFGCFSMQASGVDTVVLDKTGTITRGRPQVTRVLPVVRSEMDILAFAGSVEMLSSHPLAHAISTAAASAKAKQFKVTEGSFTQVCFS